MHITGQLPPLPPLPRLPGDATDRLPVVVVDTREQTPLTFARLPSIVGTLTTADYSIVGMEAGFAIERKTVADLVSCCCAPNRTRFEAELLRMRGITFRRLLVVGSVQEIERHEYRSAILPQAVLASLATWEVRHLVPVCFEATPESAARRVEEWAWRYAAEVVKTHALLLKGSMPTVATPAL